MSKLPVIGRTLDQCDVCGKVMHRFKIVRTNVDFLQIAANNHIPYSSYNASGWTCDATNAGSIARGPEWDRSRMSVANDGTVSVLNGVQTWTGSGTFRSASAVDVSSWTSFCFAAEVWPLYSDASELVVVSGLCDSSGANKSQQRSKTIRAGYKIWFTMNVSDIASPLSSSGIYPYIGVTGVGANWSVSRIQLEKDATKPGVYVSTSGTAVEYSTDTKLSAMRKVCPRCRERVRKISEAVGRPRVEIEPQVSTWHQEV